MNVPEHGQLSTQEVLRLALEAERARIVQRDLYLPCGFDESTGEQ